MTFEQRKQERQALIDHLLAQDWNVFGTLKFVNGRTIGRSSADKLLEPPHLNWSSAMFRKRRTDNDEQTTEAGRDYHEVEAS